MHVHEPSLRLAAALMLHWGRNDIEAVILLMADLETKEDAEDVITALLLLRTRTEDELEKLALVHV